jgi:hypothetical protein
MCLWYFVFTELIYSWSIYLGEAESGLERLHQCAEKELQVYLEAESPSKDFNDFRTKLAGLTRYIYVMVLDWVGKFGGHPTVGRHLRRARRINSYFLLAD